MVIKKASMEIRCDDVFELGCHLKAYGQDDKNWVIDRIEVFYPVDEPRYYMVYMEQEVPS